MWVRDCNEFHDCQQGKGFVGGQWIQCKNGRGESRGVDGVLSSGSYDMIVHTSPLISTYDIPTINAVGFLTGMGEEEFIEELLATAKDLVG